MSDEVWFAVAVVGLLAAIALGWRRWGQLAGAGTVTTFVVISTALGGLIGAPFWWFDLPASFAWDLLPVASRLLAAAALAFGIAGILVLERPTARRISLYLGLIALYLAPLGVAVVLFHLDRFDFTKPVTYGFFAVVIVLCLGAIPALLAGVGGERGDNTPAAAKLWLTIAGAILAVWGAVLFALPATPYPLVFNWAQDPLTSRLIAAMLFTLGVSFLLARKDASLARVSVPFGAVYGIAASVACLMNIAAGKPVPPLYCWGLGAVGAISLAVYVLFMQRSARAAPARFLGS